MYWIVSVLGMFKGARNFGHHQRGLQTRLHSRVICKTLIYIYMRDRAWTVVLQKTGIRPTPQGRKL